MAKIEPVTFKLLGIKVVDGSVYLVGTNGEVTQQLFDSKNIKWVLEKMLDGPSVTIKFETAVDCAGITVSGQRKDLCELLRGLGFATITPTSDLV